MRTSDGRLVCLCMDAHCEYMCGHCMCRCACFHACVCVCLPINCHLKEGQIKTQRERYRGGRGLHCLCSVHSVSLIMNTCV